MLEVISVHKSYGADAARTPVLHGVSLSVAQGGFLAICGPSGSGKSTLLNLIGLLDRPDAGEIRLGGVSAGFRSRAQAARLRNRMIGFVFQSFQLLPKLTSWENVALPLFHRGVGRAERRERAHAMLERVGLSDRVHHRPDQLSGGQCQRVALARALVGEPALVLADEPTGSLDRATAGQAIALLRELNRALGVTVVMVTHDQDVAAACDRVVHIRDGRLFEPEAA
ncbi:MAG: ABC transporter ATP-binding protein [Pseudomonadota bacterium]